MNKRLPILALLVLLIAALACSPGGGGDAPDTGSAGKGDSGAAPGQGGAGGKGGDNAPGGDNSSGGDNAPGGDNSSGGDNNSGGENATGGDDPSGGSDDDGGINAGNQGKGQGSGGNSGGGNNAGGNNGGSGGDFELVIDEATLGAALTAALQQAGYLGEGDSATVDIRADETILTSFPYTIEETETEVTAELVYTVFLEADGSVGVDLISATFTTEQGLSLDLPAERMDALNGAIAGALESYTGAASDMGVTLTDIVYSDTEMKLEGTTAP